MAKGRPRLYTRSDVKIKFPIPVKVHRELVKQAKRECRSLASVARDRFLSL